MALLILPITPRDVRAQEDVAATVSKLKAPVCMSDEELKGYLTALSLVTVEGILARCKASFAEELGSTRIRSVEDANKRTLERPGPEMRGANALAKSAFERAHPGSGGGAFAEVLRGELDMNMARARPETLESCEKVISLWTAKIAEEKWELALGQFGASTFERDAVRGRGTRAFPACD